MHTTSMISFKMHETIEDAPKYQYPEYKGCSIKEVHVIRGGMASGQASVDVVLEADDGQKFITMVSIGLFRQIEAVMNGAILANMDKELEHGEEDDKE